MMAAGHLEAQQRTGRAGLARLAFERSGPRTVVRTALAHSPLRLLTPRNHGHAAWAYTSSFGGGLVDGDHVALELDVGPGATALLATQGANRVYRSPRGCRNELAARVEEGALLAVVPDPTACFSGARYAQALDVRLAPTASLVLADTVTCGRGASGERWAFSHYTSALRVRVGSHALVDERWLLDPRRGRCRSGWAASTPWPPCCWWAPRRPPPARRCPSSSPRCPSRPVRG